MNNERLFQVMRDFKTSVREILSEESEEELSLDEKFFFKELISLYGSFNEILEEMDYLCKEVVAEGELNVRKGYYYIGDYKIDKSCDIEFILDGEWVRSYLSIISNESYLDLYGLKIGKDIIKARIRAS